MTYLTYLNGANYKKKSYKIVISPVFINNNFNKKYYEKVFVKIQ